jgi:hypothetical protein
MHVIAFLLVGLPATPGISANGTVALPPTVYATAYEISSRTGTKVMHWLDNERLLFVGMKAGRGPRPDLYKIYVWNAADKSINFYADGERVCVGDGFIRYVVRVNREARTEVVREGPIGSEREFTRPFPPSGRRSPNTPINNKFTCKNDIASELSPPPPEGHRIVVLRSGDGYLDFGLETPFAPTPATQELILYRPRSKGPLKLPILIREYVSAPSYSGYTDTYVLVPSKDKRQPYTSEWAWPANQAQPIYFLTREGEVRTRQIPPGTWQNAQWPSPTRAGLLFGGGDFYRSLGLYLLRADNVSKLDAGAVREIDASPDGCRAAVAIQNEHLSMGTPTNLHILDFCR